MRLEVNDERAMLVIRMQAYAYVNVTGRDMRKVEQLAHNALHGFDVMVENNFCDESGYWGNFYYSQFVLNHKAMDVLAK